MRVRLNCHALVRGKGRDLIRARGDRQGNGLIRPISRIVLGQLDNAKERLAQIVKELRHWLLGRDGETKWVVDRDVV